MPLATDSLEGLLWEVGYTPQWTDYCGHPPDSYVCSFTNQERCRDHYYEERIDMYVYSSVLSKTVEAAPSLCLRYGNDCSEYYSIGSLWDAVSASQHAERYKRAVWLLKRLGYITWHRAEN